MPVSQDQLRELCEECELQMSDEVLNILHALVQHHKCRADGRRLAPCSLSLSAPSCPCVGPGRADSLPALAPPHSLDQASSQTWRGG